MSGEREGDETKKKQRIALGSHALQLHGLGTSVVTSCHINSRLYGWPDFTITGQTLRITLHANANDNMRISVPASGPLTKKADVGELYVPSSVVAAWNFVGLSVAIRRGRGVLAFLCVAS